MLFWPASHPVVTHVHLALAIEKDELSSLVHDDYNQYHSHQHVYIHQVTSQDAVGSLGWLIFLDVLDVFKGFKPFSAEADYMQE